MRISNVQLPTELVEYIILEFWNSEHPSDERINFMTGCPLINSVWKDVFARITSRDIHVPTIAYLLYLSSIIYLDNSAIYPTSLPDSTHTITCYVDLIKSTEDAMKEPYSAFCSLPNYIGFCRCFPNLERINLEIKFRIGWHQHFLYHHQLFQTRVSIILEHAKAQLCRLPVDWSIVVDDPPYVEEVALALRRSWTTILSEITFDMVQCGRNFTPIWFARSIYSAVDGSVYQRGARHFHSQIFIKESKGDLRDINYRFKKAARRSWSLKNIFSGIHKDLQFIFNSDTVTESRAWDYILTQKKLNIFQ
ncbi:uncharacterized protein EV420DRAFT_1598370 [Desarmillaria tabescens]|uniref:Uncharacterized protein n=1 Tax=Armillaria tabescens TaxID=1929756 RepID=A0AA39J0M1_ARMTA|nr:uncharacterized protein EV420DRAFT_1598370 [Desarmillaria tabescens]KAK0433930.1 hypothetical protein EV420DRAFT_1598370 [Desarmillaria tabescens]